VSTFVIVLNCITNLLLFFSLYCFICLKI